MILTYKIKHGRDFSDELRKAKKVANFAIQTRSRSSKDVKHIGLKSMIANQILRKYSNDHRAKKAKNVKLAIPSQGIKVDRDIRTIYAPCLKLSLKYDFPDNFEKVNQIEVGEEYAYISVSISEPEITKPEAWIGIDRNTTGHIAVVADPETGKVLKLGKSALHVHQKYKNMRKRFQKKGKYGKVKQIMDRESRIVRDINHKVSRKIVDVAKETGKGIKLEDLTGIRNGKKQAKSFRYAKHSWSFYQLQQMIEYKAKLLGVEVAYVDPAYTSKSCSRCGQIGNRNGKVFKCPACGHVDHADSNAGFNIAKRPCIDRSIGERDPMEGTTDSPKGALA
jgi:putative transposase